MLLERGEEEEGEWRVRKEREGGGRRRNIHTTYIGATGQPSPIECIEVETAMCALLYTTVLHYRGGFTGNWLDPISSFLAFFVFGFEHCLAPNVWFLRGL